ncbi:MAG: hypothetical protein ACYDB3_12340, partial [Acidimicrobiales bacterium]
TIGGAPLAATLAPVPASFDTCFSPGQTTCVPSEASLAGDGTFLGSFAAAASAPTTLNLTYGSITITNLDVETFQAAFQADKHNGHVFLNTGGQNLSGRISVANEANITLAPGFNTENMLWYYHVSYLTIFGTSIADGGYTGETGSVTCPPGTDFSVYAGSTIGWFDITHEVSALGIINFGPGICGS